jgi:undecaprenyl-diphosphatase UppP
LNFFQSITLGIVQGLTEFLPISSTAHLKIVPALLGWKDPGAPATAVIQLGTAAAVVGYFAKDLWGMTKALVGALKPGGDKTSPEAQLALGVVVGTVPICVAGSVFQEYIETVFRDTRVIGVMLIAMALVLFVTDRFVTKRREIGDVTVQDGIIVGLAQVLALIPGASRSGSTLSGAFLTGLNREAAARYSFLLSVPAIVLAGLYQMKSFIRPEAPHPGASPVMEWTTPHLLVATAVSGIVGYASIAFLMRFLRTNSTTVFVVYRIAVGVVLLYLVSKGLINQ